jgi:hypothetical protein
MPISELWGGRVGRAAESGIVDGRACETCVER